MSHQNRQDPTVRIRPVKIRTPGKIGWPGPRVHVVNGRLIHLPAELRPPHLDARLDCFSPPVTHLREREQDNAPPPTTTVPAPADLLISTQYQFITTTRTTTPQCLRSASSRGPRASAQFAKQPSQPVPRHRHHGHNHTPRPSSPPRAPTPQLSNKAPPRHACPQTSRPSSSASSAPWPTASPTQRPCPTSSNSSSNSPLCRPPRRRGTRLHQTALQRLQQRQNHHQPTSPPPAACGAAPRPSSTARGTPRRARSAGPRRSR